MAGCRRGSVRRALALAIPLACAGAWLLGRVLTDRYAWSQPIWWIPSPVLVAPVAMWAAVVTSRARRRRARRGGKIEPVGSAAAGFARGAGLVLAGLMLAHLLFIEMHLHRAIGGGGVGGAGSARLVFWNQAGRDVGELSAAILQLDPDLFILANRHSGTSTRALAQAFLDTGEAHAAVGWPFDLFSRGRVVRWASTSLGLEGRSRRADGTKRDDPGWAAWFELETRAGRLIVWTVDLPSDPGMARWPLARGAGEAIAAWTGSARVSEGRGEWRAERWEGIGFPPPDVVVGDFNIPRGSASLRELLRAAGAGGMRDAFGEAGWGWGRTWPRRWPIWAIDQCFVGEALGAEVFGAVDLGAGGHRAVVVEVAPR